MINGQLLNFHNESSTFKGASRAEGGKPWELCREKIRSEIPGTFFDTFIAPLKPVVVEDGDLHLVADEKMIPYIQDRYLSLIRRTLTRMEFRGQVSLIASDRTTASPSSSSPDANTKGVQDTSGSILETFVPHPENVAQLDLLRSLEFPENIACVIGPSGSGKTTLSRIIEREGGGRGLAVERMRIEDFLIDFTESIREKSTVRWKLKLRDADLLLLDDFQYLKRTAKRSQEELKNLVDHYLEKGKRIILFSDTPLQAIEIRDDLASRLRQAYPVQLRIPNKEGRIQILEADCARLNFHPESGVIDHLAGRIDEDIRRLKSALLRLKHSGMRGIPERILDDLYTERNTIDPELVLREVAKHFEITVETLRGPARDKRISLARHTGAYFLIEMLGMKLIDVARLTGRKDHAAVIHARKKIEEMILSDLFFAQEIKQIRIKIERAALCFSGK